MAAKRKLKTSVRKTTKTLPAARASRAKRKLELVPNETSKKVMETPCETSNAPSKKGRSKISRKLLDALERRKSRENQESRIQQLFSKPPARRGRRPKNIEYSGNSYEDEYAVPETESTHLEYDTGIRATFPVDADVPMFERSEEFDEELDFG